MYMLLRCNFRFLLLMSYMEGKNTSIKDILKCLRNISSAQRALLSEICVIAKLVLVMPATNAISERSFSALRRVKT